MIFNKQDKKLLDTIANTEDKKDMLLRLVTEAMMRGTNITAPEMKTVLQIIHTALYETEKVTKVQNGDRAV